MKRILILLMIVVFVFSLIGCKSNDVSQDITDQSEGKVETPSETEEPVDEMSNQEQSDEKEKKDPEVTEQPKYIAPLTGEPSDHEIKDRIIGVMINNHAKARPQSGLHQADIVYELLTEGMITRFVAFYQSHLPEVIGPVRSIRPYFIELMNGFDAIITHAGASEQAYAVLKNSSLPDLDEIKNAGEAFWRESFRVPPHNVYTSAEKIQQAAKKRGYRSEGRIPTIPFLDENTEVKGEPAKKIVISYSSNYIVEYKYDEDSKLYLRSVNGKPHTDLESRLQLTAKNIMVIRTSHKLIKGDPYGRREINVYGPGEGYLFQNGVGKDITWQRKDGIIRPYVEKKEQGLYPGQTWVIVVPFGTSVSYE